MKRPQGWRYWTKRAARGVLVSSVRTVLVMSIVLGLYMGATAVDDLYSALPVARSS